MPLPIESATRQTPKNMVRELIGKSIEQCIKEGKSQKQCAAIAYEIASKKTEQDMSNG